MYTYEWFSESDTYIIYDKHKIILCEVQTKREAEELLSHLNRR